MSGEFIYADIPDQWELTTLGEICQRGGGNIQTGPFGSQLHASDYVTVGIPCIMPTNIGDNKIVEDSIVRITEEDANRLGQHRLVAGDIVYSRRGDVEKRALIRDHEEGWLCGTGCLKVRLGSGVVDPLFASLFLGHPGIRDWIARHAVGATMPNLNTSIMSAVPFVLPPLPEQRRIAKILGDLDDKIELNRKMNETLEQMARALFKSWFVDFDPVRAKMEGRTPADMDAATAALFPDRLVDSELGMIPEGWEVGTLGSIITSVSEKARDADAVVLSAIATSELVRSDEHFRKQVYSASIHNYKLVRQWDFAYNPSRINIGSIGMLKGPFLGAVSPVYEVFRPAPSYHWYVERILVQPRVLSAIRTMCSGSVRQSLKQADLESIELVIPSQQVINAFNKAWNELKTIIQNNIHQSRILSTLRDTLLPKLVSGEVRV